MMQGLLNTMRMQAMLAGNSRVSTVLGKVKGYNATKYCAKVIIQPDNIETGWLPIASPWVGSGWGMVAPPTDGDVVMVVCQEGDINAGIISLRLFGDDARAPSGAPSGEFWLMHQSGSLLKFHNDGTVELTANGALTVKAPSMKLQNAGSALKKLVNETFLTLFDSHVHTNGNNGANTGAPTATSSASNKTSVVQAE